MDDKHKTQEELLTELESIKDLLGNDSPRASDTKHTESDQRLLSQNIDSPIEIPVLSEMVIEDQPITKPSLEISNKKSKENIFTIQEDISKENVSDRDLPGQQSLFNKGKYKENTHALTSKIDDADQQKAGTNTNENPFLPKHIRDRLTKPSDLKAILAGDTSKIETSSALSSIIKTTAEQKKSSFITNDSPLENTQGSNEEQTLEDAFKEISDNSASKKADLIDKSTTPNDEIDRLIDHLIAQYLPKIEAKLRFQLKQSLSKKSTENTPP